MYHVVARAKAWLKAKARGSERYGILVSSQAERLRPHAIDVRPEVDPIHWACVTCDADFRFNGRGWDQYSFRASRWQRINKADRKTYQKNAYRVLLTRARQGMVIVVPEGDATF